jgi:hypothetical protein
MKKIFTLLTAALVTLTSFADHNDGRIIITDFSNKQLWIEVDGQRYRDRDRELVIDNLRPGYHDVRVYSQERRSDWGGVFDRIGRKQVLYNSTILVKSRHNTCITINRFGQVQVEERKFNKRRGRDRDEDWDQRRNRDYDRDDDHDRGKGTDRDNRYDNTRGAMDARSFEMLKSALHRESFEKSRLEIAKQTIDRNNFSSLQVREMTLLFAFETNKLELAKYAYRNTVDKNNYTMVYDVFAFRNSKEELTEYIRRFR